MVLALNLLSINRMRIAVYLVVSLLILSIPNVVWSQVAAPTQEDVNRVFSKHYGQQMLFYKPHDMPQELERTHKALVSELDKWVNLGLLIKEKTRFLAEKMMYGSLRQVSVGGFKYDLNLEHPWVSDKGFYYGRPTLKEIKSTSRPSFINANYYSEVYLTWFVSDAPDWLGTIKTNSRRERFLRRAQESHERPFEKRINLEYRDGQWGLWIEKGDQPLFRSGGARSKVQIRRLIAFKRLATRP